MITPSGGAGEPPREAPAARLQAHIELLAQADLFSGLDRIALARLAAYLDPVSCVSGEDIVVQGEYGDTFFMIAEGSFGIFVTPPNGQSEIKVATLGPGAGFGEMALLTGETRSATVRAASDGELLRLEHARLSDLLRREPSIALSISATLSRRLRTATQRTTQLSEHLDHAIDHYLAFLDPDRRTLLTQASLLEDPGEDAMHALFGSSAAAIADDLAKIELVSGRRSPIIRTALQGAFLRAEGKAGAAGYAAEASRRLAAAGLWSEAGQLAHRHAERLHFLDLFAQAPPDSLPAVQQATWAAQITDAEAEQDPRLVNLRARWPHENGSAPAASEPVGAGTAPWWRLLSGVPRAKLIPALIATGLCISSGATSGLYPQISFLLLLGAAITLWLSSLVPDFAVWLGLITGWVLFGIATPAQALAGLGTSSWITAVAILGMASAISTSGLLFRLGLLLVRHMPRGMFAQAGTLLLTGVFLTPLLPSSTARSNLVTPIALTAAVNQRLEDRGPEAAFLGLASFIGSVPLLFLFLNGSTSCLLALGLLPEATRLRFDWIQWVIAAAPLALISAVGSLALMWLVLRPGTAKATSKERLGLQMALLGQPSAREIAMAVILVATVIGWNAGPSLGIPASVVGLLSLLAAVLVGCFDRRSLQSLNWEFLISYGVILAMSQIIASLGIDQWIARGGQALLGDSLGPLPFIFGIALLNLGIRVFLPNDQTLVLLSVALVPLAPLVGIDPWVVTTTLLATYTCWFLPSQTESYRVAYEAAEGKLFTHRQAMLSCFCYMGATFIGLAVSIPWWQLLGLI